jgi:glycosyltransferase involved in cell wall biosynthesis
MKVRFVIPIRHPEGVADRAVQLSELRQTIASVAAQTSADWTATIVANRTQILPELPERVRVRHVDLPPNAALAAARNRLEIVAAIQLDKGRRIAAGLTEVEPDDLVMVVDDDDLVHRELVAFVSAQQPRCGWVINRGYWWQSGSRVLHETARFNDRCGTSLLVPPHYYAHFAGDLAEVDAIRELASHKRIFDRLPRQPPAWRYVPFPAAIYRLQGRGVSRSQLAASAAGAQEAERTGLRRRLAELRRMRFMTRRMRRDFFGAA